MTETAGLGSLFISSFLAATLLPGGSELVFSALLLTDSVGVGKAVTVATLGNSLGGLSTYLIGRFVPERKTNSRVTGWLRRWGSPALLLSWVPVVGDALCLAAGWLRVHVVPVTVFMVAGKAARYLALAALLPD